MNRLTRHLCALLFLCALAFPILASPAAAETVLGFDSSTCTVPERGTVSLKPVLIGSVDGKAVYAWNSADESIARVRNGQVTGMKAGETEVTCTLTDQSGAVYTASIRVIMIRPVQSLRFNDFSVALGQTKALNIEIRPADASNPKLRYSTSDPDIATVDENGMVTAHAVGYVKITAETTDGSNKSVSKKIPVYSFMIRTREIVITQRRTYQFDLPDYGTTNLFVRYDSSALALGNITWDRYLGTSSINDWNTVPVTGGTTGVSDFFRTSGRTYIKINPLKAGTTRLIILDAGRFFNAFQPGFSQEIKVTVAHSAVYDAVSFPQIRYTSALTAAPGTQVSFKNGTVVGSTDYHGRRAWIVATRGLTDDRVILVLPEGAKGHLSAGDKVTAYGAYREAASPESENGSTRPLPVIEAEKLNDSVYNPALEVLDFSRK